VNKVNQKQALSKKYASVLLEYAIKKNTAKVLNVGLLDNKIQVAGPNGVSTSAVWPFKTTVSASDFHPFRNKSWASKRWLEGRSELSMQTKNQGPVSLLPLSRKVRKVPYLQQVFRWSEYKWKVNPQDNQLVQQGLIPNPIRQPYNIVQELQFITFVIKHIPAFEEFIVTPTISAEKKKSFLLDLTHQFSPVTLGFLSLLGERNHLFLLPTIIEQYNDLLNNFLGVKDVTVVCSCVPTKAQYKLIKQKLEKSFLDSNKSSSGHLMLRLIYDSSLLGGVIVYDKSTKIDLSLKGKLNQLMQTI